MVDITERKRAEEALRASEHQYSEAFRREREAAQQLRELDAMKNTFLEAVSHDLRTPLTTILGSALTLEQAFGSMPTDDAHDLVRRIAASARKLERLLGDLLDLDRLQRGIVSPQRRRIDLAELVGRAVEESENPAGRPIEVDVAPAEVSLDAAKVERIVENLVANALRHTPPDAHVWVVASRRGAAACSSASTTTAPGSRPISATTSSSRSGRCRARPPSTRPGVGIGLSLVRRFAELHGGRAWVEERPGGGSSFRVFLPGRRRAAVLDLLIHRRHGRRRDRRARVRRMRSASPATGSPWVGRGGRRRARGDARTVDGRGTTLAPGFVDVHNHSDLSPLVLPEMPSTLRQGMTTVVVGNCGSSPWPLAGWDECVGLAYAAAGRPPAAGVDVLGATTSTRSTPRARR